MEENKELDDAESKELLQIIDSKIVAQNLNSDLGQGGTPTAIKQMKSNSNSINARDILWYMVLTGFMINFINRMNINIAIVKMIQANVVDNSVKLSSSECYNNTNIVNHLYSNSSLNQPIADVNRVFTIERMILNILKVDYDKNGFRWDQQQQGLVLGSVFWLNWVAQIPSGILSRKYGTKLVFGISNIVGSLLCSLMPMAAYIDIRLLLFLRVLQGCVSGVLGPSMNYIGSRWIPPCERSKFQSAFNGSSIGIALFFPISGYIISWTSWEWIFHWCSVLGIIWFIAWQYFVYDTPAKHPRIDACEREYIEKSLGSTFDNSNKICTPWLAILKSGPVWVNIMVMFGIVWCLTMFGTQIPTYFTRVLGWNIKMAGILTGLPHIGKVMFSISYALFSDHLIKSNKMSRKNVRKMAVVISNICAGLFMQAFAVTACNSYLAIAFVTLSIMACGASSSGGGAIMMDLSPNFVSIVCGISTVFTVIPGFLSPLAVGYLTMHNQSMEQWKDVFTLSSKVLLITGVIYIMFGSSEIQKWNNTNIIDEEMKEKITERKKRDTNKEKNTKDL